MFLNNDYGILQTVIFMITSLTNEKIKEYTKLNQAKYREEKGLFIVEGPHLVEEAKKAGVLVEVVTTEQNVVGTLVSEAVMKKISNTVHPVKVLGICKMINKNEIKSHVLVLDKISDPTNLGTLLRSSVAFGFETVFLSEGCVDPYNDKVIRGSQGAIFKVNIVKGDLLKFLSKIKRTHQIFGTNVRIGEDVSKVEIKPNLAIILGNEAKGMREEANQFTDSNLYIKMSNTESLNVSVAGSILMYEISKKC